ncbi:peptide chain release factor N(5)-glutamine methyltransferase [Geminisphaera colitermitum]|uniref:peptide chain release factor N(5)-glutamine methyltransferase n=1 Tax=Geminisphaera colitermitum TaxID=1148786 RepID=UPI00019655D6|nr:peptide chain release factor N(5)-glutamine methyltransferase [Geminisphaera colitermitum]
MLTILDIITKTTAFFASKGVPTPRLDAEWLVGHALGLKRMQLYMQFERPLKESELDLIRPLVRRRGAREPLQHILGTVEWCGLTLKTDRRALIPRPETEYLVELIIAKLHPSRASISSTASDVGRSAQSAPPPSVAAPSRILDLGTGTGAIALALATHFPKAAVTALDASDDALALARENAAALALDARVTFVKSNWFSALPPPPPPAATDTDISSTALDVGRSTLDVGRSAQSAAPLFDLIVSNPPYLTDAEAAAAEPEVRLHDPRSALVAPDDGLADLRTLIDQARARLVPGGLLALETGPTQHPALRALATACGYARHESAPDLAGRERFFFAWR